jgi:PAS domain S-box-containing protein
MIPVALNNREIILIEDIKQSHEFSFLIDHNPRYRNLLVSPLVLGEEVLGILTLFHRERGYFQESQKGLIRAASQQISVALNNASLFALVRDQAEDLGNLLRKQQIEASRSRAILEAVADGVLVTDVDQNVTLLNDSAEQILGVKREGIINRSLDHFIGLSGQAGQSWIGTIKKWSEDPRFSNSEELFTAQMSLDGDRVVEVRLARVIWRNSFLGTVSIFRDITQEIRVDRLKSEFLTNVSHELHTPMTSIKGYVEILLLGAAGQLSEQQSNCLDKVKSNVDRLSLLVDDLLDISRMETGRVSYSFQAINVDEITKDVLQEIEKRSIIEEKKINFSHEIPSNLPQVYGDPERVQNILMNLVRNAYSFTPEGGEVKVQIKPIDQEIEIDVVDNGIGIPLNDQARIFERFYRGEDPLVLATPGTGLGLAISKTLVEIHKGRIWFSSSGIRGQGSKFSFTLPIYNIKD